MKTKQEFYQWLKENNACEDAVKWIKANDYDARQTWEQCQRGDWLLWWAKKEGVDKRKMTRCWLEGTREENQKLTADIVRENIQPSFS